MALYLKHRPQLFSSIIGQEHIIQTVSNQVANNKVAHAYLFSGPRGVGKTTLARILAKAVNCPNRKEGNPEPCNSCNSCLEISGFRAIDVIEIDAASHTGVDNVRENIIENAQFKPTKSKYKIFIIDEVHMLSTSAFNALLKTLEEPPTHVIFILATTELPKLPETIVSRCQRFEFKKIPFEIMKKHLEKIAKEEGIKIDKDVIERLINKGDGCARDAISLLDQLMATGEKHLTAESASLVLPNTNLEKTLAWIETLVEKKMPEGVEQLNQLTKEGVNLSQFAIQIIELLRALMIEKISGKIDPSMDLSDKLRKNLGKLNNEISYPDLIRLIDLVILRSQQIKTSPLPQLPLELVVVEWCNTTGLINSYNSDNQNPQPTSKKEKGIEKETKETNEIAHEKKTIVERVKELVSTPSFNLDQLNAEWSEFLEKTEKQYPTLSFILKMTEIISVENNILTLAVQYSFHQDKLNEKTLHRHLEDILSEILGTKAKIEIIIRQAQTVTDSKELEEIASNLGGEIVN